MQDPDCMLYKQAWSEYMHSRPKTCLNNICSVCGHLSVSIKEDKSPCLHCFSCTIKTETLNWCLPAGGDTQQQAPMAATFPLQNLEKIQASRKWNMPSVWEEIMMNVHQQHMWWFSLVAWQEEVCSVHSRSKVFLAVSLHFLLVIMEHLAWLWNILLIKR